MSWLSSALSSSIGKKFIVGTTGLFLCSFLLVHVGINSLIFFNDGGHLYNEAAEFMAKNVLIRTMEIGLFVGLILHMYQAMSLALQNNSARPVKYFSENTGKANSKWYSRSMAILGTLLLMFLIIHLKHFWVVSRFTDEITSGQETLFGEMIEVFENPFFVAIYVLSQISLGYHLLHGFKSAFQTLGLNHVKYNGFIASIGVVFAIVVPILFALMPITMFLGIIK
jgi:succinate dehydrogenase / fumarate reductase cytochrome b subunit